jgi:hypothetical protein
MTVVAAGHLVSGHTKSCGCLHLENAQSVGRKHGLSKLPEFRVWTNMRQRCLHPEHPTYPYYGGRGITICDRWRDDFAAFIADMGRRPSPDLTIERKDNEKGYEPGNCVWATRLTQSRNRRKRKTLPPRHPFNGRFLRHSPSTQTTP